MANEVAGRTHRPLTWVHLPVPVDRDDAAYFTPLKDLADDYPELYLGLIHHSDGVHGAQKRIQAATDAGITDFGVATECGFGRGPAERVVPLMRLHAALARPLPAHR